jgi:lysozyme
MSEPVNPLVVDLSHWDSADDYDSVKSNGIVGVIYKATEGQSYTDTSYVQQQHAAKAAGLKWGVYHFADNSSVDGQVKNFMSFACPDQDELFCLDWEDNGGNMMSIDQVKDWITQVEDQLCRPNECVLYGGNTIKEALSGTDEFFAARRLWLCQYGSSPSWPDTWETYWLWQYTDGQYGPGPHSIDGIGSCDISSYNGQADQLIAEWASGGAQPSPPPPQPSVDQVSVLIAASPGVKVLVRQIQLGPGMTRNALKVLRANEGK